MLPLHGLGTLSPVLAVACGPVPADQQTRTTLTVFCIEGSFMVKVYSAAVASQLTAALQKLASTPKQFTLRELVAEYQGSIAQALSLGHSHESILAVFHSMGVQASWKTVSKYLRELKAAQQLETTAAVDKLDTASVAEQSGVSGLALPVSTVNGNDLTIVGGVSLTNECN